MKILLTPLEAIALRVELSDALLVTPREGGAVELTVDAMGELHVSGVLDHDPARLLACLADVHEATKGQLDRIEEILGETR